MKKTKTISILTLVMLGLTLVQPTSASQTKSLVVIDAYFDSRIIGGNVSCITPQDQPCVDTTRPPYPRGFNNAINHGNAVVEVAKKQNSALKIIALSSADSNRPTNAGDFIPALLWIDKNSDKIAAVSFSGFFNNTAKECSPSTKNTAPYGGGDKADKIIRDLISKLKSKNIPVFVSTGNTMGTKISYPACILDTVSVGTGSKNSSGQIMSQYAFSETTDYLGLADVTYFTSPVFPVIPHTTSFSAVSVAAQWITKGTLTDRVVEVLQ